MEEETKMLPLNGINTSTLRGVFQALFGFIVIPLLGYVAIQLHQIELTSATQAEQIRGIRYQLAIIIEKPRYTQREADADFELRDQLLRSLLERVRDMEVDMMADDRKPYYNDGGSGQ